MPSGFMPVVIDLRPSMKVRVLESGMGVSAHGITSKRARATHAMVAMVA